MNWDKLLDVNLLRGAAPDDSLENCQRRIDCLINFINGEYADFQQDLFDVFSDIHTLRLQYQASIDAYERKHSVDQWRDETVKAIEETMKLF